MNDKKNILELVDVHKSFTEGHQVINVLKGIDLKFYHGKWYTIYGASGSGKTTLLNIAGGLEEPDSGKLLYADNDVYRMSDYHLSNWRNTRIGFVFQFFHLIPELNVEQNIILPLKVNRLRLDEDWLCNVINVLKINDLLMRHPATLSGGEKQRVAMARAVINQPDFIIADEPTGNLDIQNSKAVIELMKDLVAKAGVGVILATHETGLMSIGDYNYQLEDGRISMIRC